MDKKDWHYLLFLLLSHHKPDKLHRTIHINIRGKTIYLCARCTGKYSALLSVFIAWFLGYGFPAWAYFPLFTFLPLPSVVDWFTQSCKLRESKNTIRVCTGFLLGIAEGLVLLTIVKGMLHLFLSAQWLDEQNDACGDYQSQQNFMVNHGFLTPVTCE